LPAAASPENRGGHRLLVRNADRPAHPSFRVEFEANALRPGPQVAGRPSGLRLGMVETFSFGRDA